MEEFVIGLLAGAIGGNLVGIFARKLSLGALVNSLTGIVGGGIGAQVIGVIIYNIVSDGAAPGPDITSMLISIISGGVGGVVVTAIIGKLRNLMFD